MNLYDILTSIFSPPEVPPKSPEERLENLSPDFFKTEEELYSSFDTSDRLLSAFLNEAQPDHRLFFKMEQLLGSYLIHQNVKHKGYGDSSIWSKNPSGIKYKEGEDGQYHFFDRNGNEINERSDKRCIDYIGLVGTVIEDLSKKRNLDYKETELEDTAYELKNTFYENLEKALPLLDEFYGVTRERNKNPHRAREILIENPRIAKMAKIYDEYLESTIKVDDLESIFAALNLVIINFIDKEKIMDPTNIHYSDYNLYYQIAAKLFDSKENIAELLKEIAPGLSYSTTFSRANHPDKAKIVLDISKYPNLLQARLDSLAIAYIKSVHSTKETIPNACKIIGTTPAELELAIQGLAIEELPEFDPNAKIVKGLNDTPVSTDHQIEENSTMEGRD